MSAIDALAHSLLAAADAPTPHERPLVSDRSLTSAEGREIQARQLALRQARGETVVGVKLGLTTPQQREQAEHFRPSVGFLTDHMGLDRHLPAHASIAPRVEPELVARVGRQLDPGSDRSEIRAAIGSVHAGIEVVDPRYPDEAFILADALADNSSARGFVVSDVGVDPEGIDLAAETVSFQVGQNEPRQGHGAVVMGNPWTVILEVLEDLLAEEMTIPEGFVIFTGNLVGQALAVAPGDTVLAQFSSLGQLRVDVVD